MVVGKITKTHSPAFLPSVSTTAQDKVSQFAASTLPKVGQSLKIVAYIAGAIIVISLIIRVVRVFQKQKLHKDNYQPIAGREVYMANISKKNIEDVLKRLPNCNQIKHIFYRRNISALDNIFTPFSSLDGLFQEKASANLGIFNNPEQILILYSSSDEASKNGVKTGNVGISNYLLEGGSCLKGTIEKWLTQNKADYKIAYVGLTWEEDQDLVIGYIPERLFNMCEERNFEAVVIKNPNHQLVDVLV